MAQMYQLLCGKLAQRLRKEEAEITVSEHACMFAQIQYRTLIKLYSLFAIM
jgi:hypothetical protein